MKIGVWPSLQREPDCNAKRRMIVPVKSGWKQGAFPRHGPQGSRRLLQWCCLLLYANPDGLPVEEDPLALLAERRAMFMGKTVSGFSGASRSMQDSAFLTGILSLLPIACGMDE